MVIVLADVANLASTALTIAIQRDWIVVITGYNRGHLAGKEIWYWCRLLFLKIILWKHTNPPVLFCFYYYYFNKRYECHHEADRSGD